VSARRALLERLIDHAALFPPASLPMDAAIAADRAARSSEHAWMLDRFIVPASRLGELPDDFAPKLSVVVDVDELPALPASVELLEVRAPRTVAAEGVRVFTEVAPGAPLPATDAKVRCGGETFPSVAALAGFVAACRDAGKPFKATAGLHHPLRTPEQHGFLNLLAAAVFAHAEGLGEGELAALLGEQDAGAFALDDDAFVARGHRADAATIAAARRELFVSYGSCSFREPVEDLQALGLL
jgi:hypothetical protein